ncbi:hypothetical protein IJ00_20690 [Calothrix sp. 336/3]|nr:hypothetical protein IJ00_20690 [Calothrix sp. 336/3]
MSLLDDLLAFAIIKDVWENLKKLLLPPKAFSWQTLIYLSLFSWLMSSFTTGFVKNLIALCGWLFLIAGTAWYTTDKPVMIPGTNMPIGALITGALVSVFAFGHGEQTTATTAKDFVTLPLRETTFVLWPTISALITAIPEFFEGSGTDVKQKIPKVEVRQKVLVLVACSMVLSCWLQLYFLVNNWLEKYPSLQTDSFQKTYVLRGGIKESIPRNGVEILEKLQPLIEEEISQQPWSEVEQWLLDAKQRVASLGRNVIEVNLRKYEEKAFWRTEPRISNVKAGYKLDLLSIWSGPSANPVGYYVRKSCTIDPIAKSKTGRVEDKGTLAEIECARINQFKREAPPPQQ